MLERSRSFRMLVGNPPCPLGWWEEYRGYYSLMTLEQAEEIAKRKIEYFNNPLLEGELPRFLLGVELLP